MWHALSPYECYEGILSLYYAQDDLWCVFDAAGFHPPPPILEDQWGQPFRINEKNGPYYRQVSANLEAWAKFLRTVVEKTPESVQELAQTMWPRCEDMWVGDEYNPDDEQDRAKMAILVAEIGAYVRQKYPPESFDAQLQERVQWVTRNGGLCKSSGDEASDAQHVEKVIWVHPGAAAFWAVWEMDARLYDLEGISWWYRPAIAAAQFGADSPSDHGGVDGVGIIAHSSVPHGATAGLLGKLAHPDHDVDLWPYIVAAARDARHDDEDVPRIANDMANDIGRVCWHKMTLDEFLVKWDRPVLPQEADAAQKT